MATKKERFSFESLSFFSAELIHNGPLFARAREHYLLALLFVYPEGVADAETTIPAGTYTISDSQAAGTVLASSGVSSTGSVGYSFFANTNAQGQLVPPLYFPVEGTVEVTKVDGKLKVEVNGLNSNNVPVHVVYGATSTAVEDVTTAGSNVKKYFEKGQLFIMKDGVKYNAIGSVVE